MNILLEVGRSLAHTVGWTPPNYSVILETNWPGNAKYFQTKDTVQLLGQWLTVAKYC